MNLMYLMYAVLLIIHFILADNKTNADFQCLSSKAFLKSLKIFTTEFILAIFMSSKLTVEVFL